MKIVMTCACLVAGYAALAAAAQDRQPGKSEKMTVDQKFVHGAASGGQFEVKLSQLALQRATRPEVKQFAQMMVDDHTRINAELIKIHGPQTIPMNPIHTAIYQEIAQKQGTDFDECYIGAQVLAHVEAIMCFSKEAKKGEKAELREFATRHLPGLKRHLQAARQLCDFDDDIAGKPQ